VELKDKADLVAQNLQKIATPVDLDSVDPNLATVGEIKSGKQMQKRALAAARRPTKSHGATLETPNIHALQHRDRPFVVALPQIDCAQSEAAGFIDFQNGSHSKRSASTARTRMA
jgi:hypothetical protein